MPCVGKSCGSSSMACSVASEAGPKIPAAIASMIDNAVIAYERRLKCECCLTYISCIDWPRRRLASTNPACKSLMEIVGFFRALTDD